MLRDAVVLAGGLGTRLGELTRMMPKPMMPVGGAPLLEHIVWNLRRHGITRIRFSVGYLADAVQDHFCDGSAFGIEATYAMESEPLGTGGGLRFATKDLDADEFLVLNGDTLFDCNYLALHEQLGKPDVLAALALRKVGDVSRYGRVRMSGDRVVGFDEKDVAGGSGVINAGVYVLRRGAVERLPGGISSIERDLLPQLAAENALAGVASAGYFVDIGIPESLRHADETVHAFRRRPAVFLDRDGVLNHDDGYVHTPEEWRWLPGAREAVRWLNDNGYLVLVTTNQAGIGRGHYSEAHFAEFTRWIDARLAEAGAHVDAWYHCPHHPTAALGEYLRDCECRKPAPGMLLRAITEWDIDIERSVMVGDSAKDMEAASAAGVRSALYAGSDLLAFVKATVAD